MTAAGRPPLQCASPIETWTGVTAAVVRCAVRGEIVAFPPPPPWKPCSPAAGLICVAAKKGRVGGSEMGQRTKRNEKEVVYVRHLLSQSLRIKKKKFRGGQQSEQCCGMWKRFLTSKRSAVFWSLDGGTSPVWCDLVDVSVVSSCVWCT